MAMREKAWMKMESHFGDSVFQKELKAIGWQRQRSGIDLGGNYEFLIWGRYGMLRKTLH